MAKKIYDGKVSDKRSRERLRLTLKNTVSKLQKYLLRCLGLRFSDYPARDKT